MPQKGRSNNLYNSSVFPEIGNIPGIRMLFPRVFEQPVADSGANEMHWLASGYFMQQAVCTNSLTSYCWAYMYFLARGIKLV